MKIKKPLVLWDDDEHGKVSPIGTIKMTSIGYRFDPADEWVLNTKQLRQVAAILEALNE